MNIKLLLSALIAIALLVALWLVFNSSEKPQPASIEPSIPEPSSAAQTRSEITPGTPSSDSDISQFMMVTELESLKQEFAQFVTQDQDKLTRLIELATKKISLDAEAARSNITALSNQELNALNSPEQDLSPEQLMQKQELFMQQDQIAELREENRIAFEDGIREILNADELAALQQLEQAKAQRSFLQQTQMLAVNMRVAVTGLTDQQLNDLDQIAESYSRQNIGSVPLGATLGASVSGQDLMSSELYNEYLAALMAPLSEEQIEQFVMSPLLIRP